MEVKSFFFTSGIEVIAKLINTGPSTYVIQDPLVVHMMRGPDGSPQLAFAPMSMVRKDQDITVFAHALMTEPVDVEDAVETSYLSNTSGLQIVGAGSQLLQG